MVESCRAEGRPVLIGTSSVNESERLLAVLEGAAAAESAAAAAGGSSAWVHDCAMGSSSAPPVQLLNAKPENVRLEAQVRQEGVTWVP